MKRTRFAVLGSIAVATGLLVALPSASATVLPPFLWSAPAAFDVDQNGSNFPSAVSCASPSLCVAADGYGNVLTSTNPAGGASTWTRTNIESTIVGGLTVLGGISCPSASFCATTEHLGTVFTSTQPTGGASAWTSRQIFGIFGPNGVSCPSSSFCAAFFNDALTTSTNPTGAPTDWSDGFTDGHVFRGVSCPSTLLCVAVDDGGNVIVSTDPTDSTPTWTVSAVDSGGSLDAVSCPTASFCVATGSAGQVVTSTNPTGGPTAWTTNTVDATNAITAVSCPSSSRCLATDNNGNTLYSASPTGGAAAWTTTKVDANSQLTGISCPSIGTCIAVDHDGNELVGSPAPATVELTVDVGGAGSGNVTASPAGISCPAACAHSYPYGTDATVTALPDAGSTFTGWSGGGCSGTGDCQLTLGADTTVTATFAPQPKCTVPKLKGKALAAAKQAIRSHNCSTGKITHARSRTIKKGHVIAQKPKPGSRLKHGAKVSLVVSKGK